jgi:hypothetical protein
MATDQQFKHSDVIDVNLSPFDDLVKARFRVNTSVRAHFPWSGSGWEAERERGVEAIHNTSKLAFH